MSVLRFLWPTHLPLFFFACFICFSERQVLQQQSDALRKDVSSWLRTREVDFDKFLSEGSAVVLTSHRSRGLQAFPKQESNLEVVRFCSLLEQKRPAHHVSQRTVLAGDIQLLTCSSGVYFELNFFRRHFGFDVGSNCRSIPGVRFQNPPPPYSCQALVESVSNI